MPELETPWLRDALVGHLGNMSSPDWLALDEAGRPAQDLDDVLDFFDDTGVADEPQGRIGYVLRAEHEAAAMSEFGQVLDQALDTGDWRKVPSAAADALAALRSELP